MGEGGVSDRHKDFACTYEEAIESHREEIEEGNRK